MGTPAELTARQRHVVVSFRLPADAPLESLPALGGTPVTDGAAWTLATEHPTAALHALSGWALARGVELPALEVRRPSLEDAYLELVGAELAGEHVGAVPPTVRS